MSIIPFIRLDRQFERLKPEVMPAIERILSKGQVLQGMETKKLESSLCKLLKKKYCITVNSGTDALNFSLASLNLPKGSKVAVSSMSFIASASVILHNDCIPVFVDVDPETMLMNQDNILELINNESIDAIIAVHLYGQMQPLEKVGKSAAAKKIPIIEDAAQSLGATRFAMPSEGYSEFTCISFDPTKVIGAYGSGGAILTNNPELAEHIKLLRYHGHSGDGEYILAGFNSQMAEIQASLLNIKLNYLKEWQKKRTIIAEHYNNELKDLDSIKFFKTLDGNVHNFHKYVILHENRDGLVKFLKNEGIITKIHYSTPLHQQKEFENISSKRQLSIVEKLAKNIISLPIYPELTISEISKVTESIKNFIVK